MEYFNKFIDWHEALVYKWIERLEITEYQAMWVGWGKGLILGLLLWCIF